ncbi:MAG: amidohydrolase family protein [Bacillota bacterium]
MLVPPPPLHLIDAHVHLMTPERIASGLRWIRRVVPEYSALSGDVTADDLLADLRAAGAGAVFSFFYPLQGGESVVINRWQRDLAGRRPEVVAFASVHSDDDRPAEVVATAFEDLNLAGLKLHPYVQGLDPLDRRLARALAVVEESGRPLVLHTGFSGFYGRDPLTGAVDEILRRYPRLRLVAAHLLYGDLPLSRWAERLEAHPNLYLDATNVLSLARPGTSEGAQLSALLADWSHRVTFGTDYPMGMAYPVDCLYSLPAAIAPGPDALEDLSWRTAARLVGPSCLPPSIARDLALNPAPPP